MLYPVSGHVTQISGHVVEKSNESNAVSISMALNYTEHQFMLRPWLNMRKSKASVHVPAKTPG